MRSISRSLPATCLAAIAALARVPGVAAAEERPAFVSRPGVEWAITVAGGALWLTETLLIAELAPSDCRWCEPNALDDRARGLAWSNTNAARTTSDVLSYGIAPLVAGGLVALGALQDDRAGDLVTDLLIVAQAGVAAGVSGDLIRVVTGRERPWVHDLAPEDKPETDRPEQNNLSFISGHAATAFALAVSSGSVASRRGRRIAPAIWATGLTLAATTSYLRIASEQHYLTDVLAGIGAGVGIGLAVPYLHRPPESRPDVGAMVAPVPGGALILLTVR